ncbi:hypothetical protein LF41_980 [Lysobacter dokdonensis DS-58]|uniref:Uncharacterized protein n=1 Tax=Lysobacter dokdonensis DS-58 TaxID=1300345 RepID=A0A0A2WKV2_9GAMM|nr:hypothetical protein LF41_980 [Lysobacter dokdonensis DS-58]
MGIGAVDVDFREQGEIDVVGERAEVLDLGLVTGFLVAELVAREPEDHQALVAIVLPEFFQARVLRREPALGGDVDDQQHLARVVGERTLLAVDVGGGEIERGGHGVEFRGDVGSPGV